MKPCDRMQIRVQHFAGWTGDGPSRAAPEIEGVHRALRSCDVLCPTWKNPFLQLKVDLLCALRPDAGPIEVAQASSIQEVNGLV